MTRPNGIGVIPVDYPWQVAPLQSLLMFHQPVILSSIHWRLSSFFSLRFLPFGFTSFSGGGKFRVSGGMNYFSSALELIVRRYISNRTVKANIVVMIHKISYDNSGVF